MLPASLTGQALTAYHQLSEKERLSSSSVLNVVAATFSPTCEEAQKKFFPLTMTDKDVRAYLKELEILLDASPLKDLTSVSKQSVLWQRFKGGLPQDVQTVLHVQSSSVPLQEIVSIARRYLQRSFTEEPQRPSFVQYYGRNTFRTSRRGTSALASNVTPTHLFSRPIGYRFLVTVLAVVSRAIVPGNVRGRTWETTTGCLKWPAGSPKNSGQCVFVKDCHGDEC